jgi:starch phosphorylase
VETVDEPEGQAYLFRVRISAGRVPRDAFRVEVYGEPAEIHALERTAEEAGALSYAGLVPAERPAGDYTARIVPWHPGARVPLESSHILWYG